MKRLLPHALLLLAAGLSLLSTAAAAATTPAYSIVELGSLGGGYSQAYAINNLGQIVGESTTASGAFHAFLYSGGTMQDLGTPATSSRATGLNDSGQIVGRFYDVTTNNYRAFVYSDGVMHDIFGPSSPGASYYFNSVAYDINNKGQVVGLLSGNKEPLGVSGYMSSGTTAVGSTRMPKTTPSAINDAGQMVGVGPSGAFVSDKGSITQLTQAYSAWDINESGVVVGAASDGAGGHYAYSWFNGVYTNLSANLYQGDPVARAINDLGGVVGQYYGVVEHGTSYTGYAGFITIDGEAIDLNTLIDTSAGMFIRDAIDINNAGQILATACNGISPFGSTGCHTVLLDHFSTTSPVPEPSSVALMSIGLGMGLVASRRRSADRR